MVPALVSSDTEHPGGGGRALLPLTAALFQAAVDGRMDGWTAGVVGTHTTLSQEANPSTCHSVGERLCYAE